MEPLSFDVATLFVALGLSTDLATHTKGGPNPRDGINVFSLFEIHFFRTKGWETVDFHGQCWIPTS